MANCSKPVNMAFMGKDAIDLKKQCFNLSGPKGAGKAARTHLDVIGDSVNIFMWYQLSDNKKEFQEIFSDWYGVIDIKGQKLTEKEGVDKKWF